MKYKISYKKRFGDNGSVYTQFISCKMSYAEIDEFNLYVNKVRAKIKDKCVKTSLDLYTLAFLKNIGRGYNYTTLTTMKKFCEMFNVDSDARWKYRNTIICVNI